jgi:hypothetical protein
VPVDFCFLDGAAVGGLLPLVFLFLPNSAWMSSSRGLSVACLVVLWSLLSTPVPSVENVTMNLPGETLSLGSVVGCQNQLWSRFESDGGNGRCCHCRVTWSHVEYQLSVVYTFLSLVEVVGLLVVFAFPPLAGLKCHRRVVFLFVSELKSLSLDMIRWLVT